jgi:hypothetical protein
MQINNVISINILKLIVVVLYRMEDDVVTIGNEMIFTPYNSKNKEISLNDVQTILLKYGVLYKINHFELFKRAFVHSSYCNRTFSDAKTQY